MKYYYGGVVTGRILSPSGQGRLSITNSVQDAALMALSEKGYVAEIRPVGRVVNDRDGERGVWFVCKRAKIVRVFEWKEIVEIMEESIGHDIETPDTQVSVRPEEEV